MTWIANYARSSIGMKHIMGVTGLAMVGFLLVHMAGNLLIFAGPDALNGYAVKLRGLGPLLWVARIGLITLFLAHTVAALRLSAINSEARPVKYDRYSPQRTPFYARYMRMTGLVLLAFIVFHLAQLTFHVVLPDNAVFVDDAGRFDVYSMTVLGFQNIGVAVSYMVAMLLLCAHLAHGIPSFFQSLGLTHPKYESLIKKSGPALAGLLFIGNVSMPAAALAQVLELPAWAVVG